MDLLLQVAYSLASQPVRYCDDAASDPTGVSAPASALLLLPVHVPSPALSSGCQESTHSCSMQPLEWWLQGLVLSWLAWLTTACQGLQATPDTT